MHLAIWSKPSTCREPLLKKRHYYEITDLHKNVSHKMKLCIKKLCAGYSRSNRKIKLCYSKHHMFHSISVKVKCLNLQSSIKCIYMR